MSYFVKVCGITNLIDLDLVMSLPIDGIGFNLYEKSKRFIDLNEAVKMSEKLPEHLQVFLIFVNLFLSSLDHTFIIFCVRRII